MKQTSFKKTKHLTKDRDCLRCTKTKKKQKQNNKTRMLSKSCNTLLIIRKYNLRNYF